MEEDPQSVLHLPHIPVQEVNALHTSLRQQGVSGFAHGYFNGPSPDELSDELDFPMYFYVETESSSGLELLIWKSKHAATRTSLLNEPESSGIPLLRFDLPIPPKLPAGAEKPDSGVGAVRNLVRRLLRRFTS
jgi:hypothetical protein